MWTAPREWPGETAFIIAGGPSVAAQDVEALRGRRVIVVNSSYLIAPWADFLVFGDSRWWGEHRGRLEAFQGRIVTCSDIRNARVLPMLKVACPPGIAEDRSSLTFGRTSLQAAMNLAVHLGAARIVLLGADMQPAPDGRTHHHEPHIWPQKRGCWDEQMKHLVHAARWLKEHGVEVINTSPASRLPWFEKRAFRECLSLS